MALTLLYSQSKAGYSVIAKSHGDAELDRQLERLVRSLQLNPHDLELGDGWLWVELPAGLRAFARIQMLSRPKERPAIEMRILCLDEQECKLACWNPFLLSSVIEEDRLWIPNDQAVLQSPKLPYVAVVSQSTRSGIALPRILPWQPIAGCSKRVLHECVELVPISSRREFSFAGPTSATNLQFHLLLAPIGVGSRRALVRRREGDHPRSTLPLFFGAAILAATVVAICWPFYNDATGARKELGQERLLSAQRLQQIEELQRKREASDEARREYIISIQEAVRSLASEYKTSFGEGADDLQSRWRVVEHYLSRPEGLEDALKNWAELEKLYTPTERRVQKLRDVSQTLRRELESLSQLLRKISDSPRSSEIGAQSKRLREILDSVSTTIEELQRAIKEKETASSGTTR